MKISRSTIRKIVVEYETWFSVQYANNTMEQRKKLGQFYTPPSLTVKMLMKFDNLDGKILDPTVGAGNLLAAAIIAGANPKKCYGIELDKNIAKLARNRLEKLGVPRRNIKCGDALQEKSYKF